MYYETHLDVLEGLLEGEAHTTADDQGVDLNISLLIPFLQRS
jgi:hypothetical protein